MMLLTCMAILPRATMLSAAAVLVAGCGGAISRAVLLTCSVMQDQHTSDMG